jgi:transposase
MENDFMMGQLPPAQNALFYDFNLDRHIPADHLLRRIDEFLDFNAIRQHLEPFYSPIGRPSIDPELMIRMLLVGYCYGIHSERRLCEEVSMNLAYRWFCQLGLEDVIPDHSTFSKNRLGRFRSADLLRMIFDTVVKRCIEESLVKGEGFAIDASLVRADVARQRSELSPVDWTPAKVQTRAVKEYLAKLDQEADLNRPQKSVSLTDPMAQWSGAKGRAQFYYSTNYLIDTEHGVIMDVEAAPSTLSLEVATTRTMIERVESTHAIKPQRLLGDTAYGAAKNLGYLVEEKGIEPHVPVQDKSQGKEETFAIEAFEWDAEASHYHCPAGKTLKRSNRNFRVPRTGITKAGTIIYRAHQADCKVCPMKWQCCPNTTHRKIARSIYEESRDKARAINETDAYRTKSFHERKKVEMLFAHMKRHLRFTRLRLRGLASANDEFLMMATVQNLRRMARLCARPPPDHKVTAPGDQVLA